MERRVFFVSALLASLTAIWCGFIFFSSSLSAAWFNWFQIPTHQPYSKALLFPVIDGLARQLFLYILPTAFVLARHARPAKAFEWKGAWRSPTILLIWVGCCLLPTSILGRMKFGGSINALSPVTYFFALACALELTAFLRLPRKTKPQRLFMPIILMLILGVFVCIRLPECCYYLLKGSPSGPMEGVYDFSRRNPGNVYFPQFPLTVLMAEGYLYNFSWGLTDRRAAGYPVSESQFLEYAPRSAKTMALVPWVPDWDRDVSSRCIAGRIPTKIPALPGFALCSFR